MSIQLKDSEKLLDMIKDMLKSATSSILLVTYKLDQDSASELLVKAASGVETVVITSDKDWARWLNNQRDSYKRDEEIKLGNELKRAQLLYVQILYFVILISFIIIGVDILLFFIIGNMIYIDLILSTVAIILIVYYGLRRRKQLLTQINLLRENFQNLTQEINQVRDKIKEKLKIIETNKELTFSVLSCDDRTIIFSAPFKLSTVTNSVHIVTEISKEFLNQVINSLKN